MDTFNFKLYFYISQTSDILSINTVITDLIILQYRKHRGRSKEYIQAKADKKLFMISRLLQNVNNIYSKNIVV